MNRGDGGSSVVHLTIGIDEGGMVDEVSYI